MGHPEASAEGSSSSGQRSLRDDEDSSLTVRERLEWKRPHFLWAQSDNAINGSTDGEASANLLAIGLRGDWKPQGRLSVYSLVNYDRNRFADIGRRFEEGGGLG
jgi:hypothetical protein